MYKIYFYSEPNLLFIDSETIIDLDLKMMDSQKVFEMIYDDLFFDLNLTNSKSDNWLITIQSYDENGKFVLQSNLHGDEMTIRKVKKGKRIRLVYDQITNNKIWGSIPPEFERGEVLYKQGKLSFERNVKLKNLLNN